MSDSIETHYVKGGFAVSDDIVLSTSKRTRTVFRPGMHGGGVRGQIIRQKIGDDGKWKDVNEVNFNQVPPNCGVSIELDTQATQKLFTKLTHLYQVQSQGISYGDEKFVVAKASEILLVDDASKQKAIQEILDQGYSEEFWTKLSEKDHDLATRLSVAQIQIDRQEAVKEFENSMVSHAGDEAYWQNFFEQNPWILQYVFSAPVFMLRGETYLGGKAPIGRAGVGGVATDYLFGDESTKSFAVVDIKPPDAGLVGPVYRGVKGSGHDNETYSMHADLSGALVQIRNQITVAIENFQSVLGPGFANKLNRVHPKGVLITGNTTGLSLREKDSFNQFRHGQYSLTIITYDELLQRLKLLFDPASPEEDKADPAEASTEVEDSINDSPINLDDIDF